ncbi:Cation/H+ exchanger [Arabidopsis thaliana x Arabidopsis arenosa]|uniref:Cation/H+ exchanger n=1 Tax=Arabidopsis thaliana x Arabidopsis arenosa TaxID=1240361 RepID=A0A8T2BEW9_9BRAS|nr:Cation/H+ exchanger [Arabidopsis thaliana x Arabidopsis arenosa]
MGTLVNGTIPAMKCPKNVAMMKATSNGVFDGESPLDFAFPLVILQICLVVAVTRSLAFLLRPMRQPRVVAEIIGGILLGPSALGRITSYKNSIFPARSLTVLDTLANLGLLLFLFLVGLEIDLTSLRRTGKKAISIAAAGMLLPFGMGIVTSFAFPEASSSGDNSKVLPFIIFMGVALSITAFGVLARILAELKLLTTDLGRISMSAAAINDVAAWVLLALAVSLSGDRNSPLVPLWVLLSGIAFVIACFLIVPRIFKFIARRCPEGEPIGEMYVCVALCSVLIAGFATDAIGIHAIFGAFVMGVLFPKGHFADAIVEKIEDLVMGLLLPLYFVMSGLKTDITTIQGVKSWGRLALVIVTACFGKIVGTVSVALLCKVGFRESVVLGVLMNTKGLVELIVLNIGKDRKVLSDQTFAIMVLMAIFTTFITTPIVLGLYKPSETTQTHSSGSYKNRKYRRKIENDEEGEKTQQLKVLVCLQSSKDIDPMMKIIEATRGSNETKERFCVYVMHLTQLSERPSSIRMVQKARRNGVPFWNKKRDNSSAVTVAFEASSKLSSVSVRSVTAISPLSTIHEDICSSADSKRATFVILPFHKQWRSLEKEFETVRSEYQGINKRVLENSPCSVGILVDRGLGDNNSSNFSLSVNVLFFGGCDDREALVYGLRMAEHPGVNLTVVVISGLERSRFDILEAQETSIYSVDEQFLAAIKKRANATRFEERTVESTEEVVEIIRKFCECDLLLVGRSSKGTMVSRLTVMKIECPKLGSVGNLIVSNEISTSVSVLVVQQYTGKIPSVVGSVTVPVVETP